MNEASVALAPGKTKDGPLVSVVIATYRRKDSLMRAIQSVVNQSYGSIETIVVDDNADREWNDAVNQIVSHFSDAGENLIYIKNEANKGSAETRNIGIRASSGEYITFLDDDDIYLPDKVDNQIRHMRKEKSDFSITDLHLYNEAGRLAEVRTRNYIKRYDTPSLLKYHLMHHMTGTDIMMFRRQYLERIGGFPPIDVGDEFYLMKEAIVNGGRLSYLPGCHVKAYIHTQTGGLSSGEGKLKGENALYEYKKSLFCELDKRTVRYIKMRHYAVLGFAEVRRKRFFPFFKNAVMAFFSSPTGCFKLILQRR